jgi:diguanylate cyclase (GGDEF)-like protein
VLVELVNYRKDGTPFWTELLITPLCADDGTVTHFVSVQRNTTARKHAEFVLRQELLVSELTGLLNRTGFEQAIEQALALDAAQPPAVVLFDVAGLRNVNYTFGRKGGDEVLVEHAARLRHIAADGVTVGQLAGGEFGVLMEGATTPAVVALCERARRALLAPVTVLGTEISLDVSGGVVVADRSATAASLLREADLARRVAAAAGDGHYELYEPGMGQALAQRLDIDQGVRRAVDRGELLLHHQPVVDLFDGTATHAEALVRWDRPGHGPMSPASFIPIAEATGAILPVGTWVLSEACVQASGWQSVLPGVGVAVNLSPRQFAGRDLASDVARALDGLAPQLLTVEVTEGALVADPAAAAEQLERLAGTGVRIALDDFGTGYSSLAYLKRLPVHTVKIDKVFVDGVESDTGDRAIVRAVLALARDLGLHVIAEGVETPRQRDALLALGCTWAQGYLFSRPVSLDRLQQACGDAERVAAALNASA